MDIWSQYVLPCLCAFAGCIGFTLVFNIHGPGKLIACCGGALGWLVYLLGGKTILAGFFAAMAISLFSEVMARIRRCPVTGYQLVALLPLVPGGVRVYFQPYQVAPWSAGTQRVFIPRVADGRAGDLAFHFLHELRVQVHSHDLAAELIQPLRDRGAEAAEADDQICFFHCIILISISRS